MIREFVAGDQGDFRRLNEEWISHYFSLEPKDEETLDDPQGSILGGGGRIFLAILDGKAVGCCALLAIGPGEYEVVKMAVTESARGTGIGRALLERTIAEARALAAARLFLETSSKLTPAIRLYESVGFRRLPPERVTPSPYVRSDVSMEMLLDLRQPGSRPV